MYMSQLVMSAVAILLGIGEWGCTSVTVSCLSQLVMSAVVVLLGIGEWGILTVPQHFVSHG